MALVNAGLLMSPTSYIEGKQYLDNRMDRFASNLGKVGAGLYNMKLQEKKAKTMKDIMDAWDYSHSADDFTFDEDAFVSNTQATKRQALEDLRRGQIDYEAEQEAINKRSGQFEYEKMMQDELVSDELARRKLANPMLGEPGVIPEPPVEEPMRYTPVEIPSDEELLSYGDVSVRPEEISSLVTEEDLMVTPEMIAEERERQYGSLFESPEERETYEKMREVYQPGMTDVDKYRRASSLMAPYDPEASEDMMKYAEERDRFETELGIKQAQDAAKAPREQLIELGKRYNNIQRQNELLMQRRSNLDPTQTSVRQSIDSQIEANSNELNRLAEVGRSISSDTTYEDIYATPEVEETGIPTQIVEPVERFGKPSIESLGQVNDVKADIDQAVIDGQISKEQADLYKRRVDLQAQNLREAAAPKVNAVNDWKKFNAPKSEYSDRKAKLRDWAGDYKTLKKFSLKPNLNQSERSALAFKIARMNTGPGSLTESEVASSMGMNNYDEVLQSLGLYNFVKGTEYEESKIKESIQTAMSVGIGSGQSYVDSMNDLINDSYNQFNPGFEKELENLTKYISGSSKDKANKPKRKRKASW